VRFYLRDQLPHLPTLFGAYGGRSLSYDTNTPLVEKKTSLAIQTSGATSRFNTHSFGFLFDYELFPHRILTFAAQWRHQNRAMQVGDVIVQQVYLPPFGLSLKCVFAVRILDIVREPTRVGFSYGTLLGHAEMGRSDFAIFLQDGEVHAQIHTFSAPGNPLTRLVAPFFTIPYQAYCTRLALERMRASYMSTT
jgi:hypothetical protein